MDSRWSFSGRSGLVQRPIPEQLPVCFTYVAVTRLPALYDPGYRPISVPLLPLAATSLCTWSVSCFCNTSIVLGDTHYVSRWCLHTVRHCAKGWQVAIPLVCCCRYVLAGVGVPLLLYVVDAAGCRDVQHAFTGCTYTACCSRPLPCCCSRCCSMSVVMPLQPPANIP